MGVRAGLYRGLDVVRWQFRDSHVLEARRFAAENQWRSPEQIRDHQDKTLHRLIEHVYKHVPYYRNVMQTRGLTPEDIRTTDDLTKLPVLDKQIFRQRWKEFISDEANPDMVRVRRTGGTTGQPLRIARDPMNAACENAAFYRGLGFSGYRRGEKIVKLFGGSLGLAPESRLTRFKARLSGELFLPAFEVSRENVAEYVRTIQQGRAEFVRGFASAVYLLARWMMEAGLQLRLNAVFSTAEMLYEPQSELITDRLGEVFEYYGCGEVNSIAFECGMHNGLHVSDEHVFLEALRDGERVLDGEMGAVTLTTLQNYTMPLIRYQNGDVVACTSKACSCGRGLSRILKLLGRTNDLLLARDGRLISGVFMPAFLVRVDMQGVQQVQLIQETQDAIRLKVVRTTAYSIDSLRPLLEVIIRHLGDVKIKVEYVDSIPTAPSGKCRYVISKVGGNLQETGGVQNE